MSAQYAQSNKTAGRGHKGSRRRPQVDSSKVPNPKASTLKSLADKLPGLANKAGSLFCRALIYEIPIQPVRPKSQRSFGCPKLPNPDLPKPQGMFVDINVNSADVVTGVIADATCVPLVCREYAGFSGNLVFHRHARKRRPVYDGLGSRYSLVHLTAEEYALIQ